MKKMNQLKLDHIGLNAANKGDALVLAQAFCQLLGCPVEEKPASVYAGPSVEVMAGGGRGEKGHLGFVTPNLAQTMAEFKARGIAFDETSGKYTSDGKLRLIYLQGELGGFAIHLMEK